MESNYEYEKYIWQIQFRNWEPINDIVAHATIDYENRIIIFSKTDIRNKLTKEETYRIDDGDFDRLLSYSEIAKIQAYEKKLLEINDMEKSTLDVGYRDGWSLEYSYFTHYNPPRIDGLLNVIYRDNPLEGIVKFIRKGFPNAIIYK